jgi:hypothetical protein
VPIGALRSLRCRPAQAATPGSARRQVICRTRGQSCLGGFFSSLH